MGRTHEVSQQESQWNKRYWLLVGCISLLTVLPSFILGTMLQS